jgi:TRAP-type C4-dicarboxylate transport system permease small subunit
VPVLRRFGLALAVALMAVMSWQGWIAARDAVAFNDVTSDLGLPRLWYWIPVLAGMIGAAVAAAVMFFSSDKK